jgi:ribosomal protein S12 methylthiotransferase accessory factor
MRLPIMPVRLRRLQVLDGSSKDVCRFAPNYTVFVLPPDAVCLYSEDRKFFLHGELYGALASAIGSGRSIRALVNELERHFPTDRIHEALKRLVDRRFVYLKEPFSVGAVAAYWSSLGLSPEIVEKNFQETRVRIQSIDAPGANELGAALNELGVRVVKRSADFTITLVSDYLEARLADRNRRHLSDQTPWLLLQPVGMFPLVGPIFSPGRSACWTCLADRMKLNREVKAFLDTVDDINSTVAKQIAPLLKQIDATGAAVPKEVTDLLAVSASDPLSLTPDDIARTVLFLATEAPDALTGSCIDVFG